MSRGWSSASCLLTPMGKPTRHGHALRLPCRGIHRLSKTPSPVIEQNEREKVARALNVHLWWMKKANPMDNFVSWTSSLLFAIQYVFYRHLNDKRPLEEIKLFVIDTTQFRQGTLILDLNLIEEFQHDNPLYCERTLPKLWEWRTGNLYFGEYLSQGSLGIAGKCQVISLKASADDDSLFTLQPRFSDTCRMPPGKKRPEWVYPVLNLRKEIFSDTPLKTRGREDMADRMKAVLNIANRFEPGWKLPMAVYFAASICKRLQSRDELMLLECFTTGPFSAEERNACRPSSVKIIAPDAMPELTRVEEIFRQVYKDYRLQQVFDRLDDAKFAIRDAQSLIFEEEPDIHLTADSNPSLNCAGETLTVNLTILKDLVQSVWRKVDKR